MDHDPRRGVLLVSIHRTAIQTGWIDAVVASGGNVLKDRPPSNRTPLPEEMEACLPFLQEQLAIIQPKIICVLGAIAAKALLGPHVAITKIRGTLHTYQGIPLMPTFHPAYLLRNPPAKRFVWTDLKKIKKMLEE